MISPIVYYVPVGQVVFSSLVEHAIEMAINFLTGGRHVFLVDGMTRQEFLKFLLDNPDFRCEHGGPDWLSEQSEAYYLDLASLDLSIPREAIKRYVRHCRRRVAKENPAYRRHINWLAATTNRRPKKNCGDPRISNN